MVTKLQGRDYIRVGVDVDLPLIGTLPFGIIDRGTNVVEVRPNSYCPLNCIFCSTDAGPNSRWRQTEYDVDLDLLVSWVKEVTKAKGTNVEVHIDGVGEPLMYGKLPDLVQAIREIPNVKVISMQTHGSLLSYKLAENLSEAGLDRVNLSIDTTDVERGKFLQGTEWYRVDRVMEVAEHILKDTKTDVLIAPVWIPGINDNDIEGVIEWGKKVGVGKRFPGYGIQLFLRHKHGRKPKGCKVLTFHEFEKKLAELEEKHKVKLRFRPEDFGISRAPSVPTVFRIGEKVKLKIEAKGWLKNELLAVALDDRKYARVITLIDETNTLNVGDKVIGVISENKNNLYLARPLKFI